MTCFQFWRCCGYRMKRRVKVLCFFFFENIFHPPIYRVTVICSPLQIATLYFSCVRALAFFIYIYSWKPTRFAQHERLLHSDINPLTIKAREVTHSDLINFIRSPLRNFALVQREIFLLNAVIESLFYFYLIRIKQNKRTSIIFSQLKKRIPSC